MLVQYMSYALDIVPRIFMEHLVLHLATSDTCDLLPRIDQKWLNLCLDTSYTPPKKKHNTRSGEALTSEYWVNNSIGAKN